MSIASAKTLSYKGDFFGGEAEYKYVLNEANGERIFNGKFKYKKRLGGSATGNFLDNIREGKWTFKDFDSNISLTRNRCHRTFDVDVDFGQGALFGFIKYTHKTDVNGDYSYYEKDLIVEGGISNNTFVGEMKISGYYNTTLHFDQNGLLDCTFSIDYSTIPSIRKNVLITYEFEHGKLIKTTQKELATGDISIISIRAKDVDIVKILSGVYNDIYKAETLDIDFTRGITPIKYFTVIRP